MLGEGIILFKMFWGRRKGGFPLQNAPNLVPRPGQVRVGVGHRISQEALILAR